MRTRAALVPMLLAGLAAALLPAPSTAEPTWLSPAVPLGDPGYTLNSPDVAIGSSGTAVAVWTESSSTVRSAVRPRGGAWSEPIYLPTKGNNSGSPVVALGPDGAAVAAWCSTVGGDQVIEVAESPDGKTWGASTVLSGDTNLNSEALVVVGPTGEATVMWDSVDGANQVLVTAVRPAGGDWGPAVTLTPGANAFSPDLVVDEHGVVTALWTGYNALHTVVRAASRQPGGGWGATADVSDTAEDATLPDLAVGPGGVLTASCLAGVAPATTVEFSIRGSAGAWSAPRTASEAAGTYVDPAVAVGTDGSTNIAWVVEAAGQ